MTKGRILLALLLLPLLGGCDNLSLMPAGKILPPAYDACPLEGKWSVMEELASEGYSGASVLGQEADPLQFSRRMVILGSYVWHQPAYKIKRVNSRDYLMTRHIVLDGYLASINQTVDIVSVSAGANYLGEFMRIDDATIISFVQNKVLLLHKASDRVDDPSLAANLSVADVNRYDNTGISGILIGLRIPSNGEYAYKTVWIAADNKKPRLVLSREDIFFPRRSGFWELRVKSGSKLGRAELRAQNVAIKNTKEDLEDSFLDEATTLGTQGIVVYYIGNDYVTLARNNGSEKLQVLPVDQLSSPLGIKVADLLGDTGLTAYLGARQQALQALGNQGIKLIDEDSGEDNFGLNRRNGHWYLQGRINYRQDGTPKTLEFNINCIPPDSLVSYDTLYLSWQSIRDRVPNAVDAFTSPNKDIAVIKTPSQLYFFGISGEQLDSVPLGAIDLQEGTSVIMAEWATGFYVDDWEKSFINNGARRQG